jgi:hypothetical protein
VWLRAGDFVDERAAVCPHVSGRKIFGGRRVADGRFYGDARRRARCYLLLRGRGGLRGRRGVRRGGRGAEVVQRADAETVERRRAFVPLQAAGRRRPGEAHEGLFDLRHRARRRVVVHQEQGRAQLGGGRAPPVEREDEEAL